MLILTVTLEIMQLNDDAIRAVKLFYKYYCNAVLEGKQGNSLLTKSAEDSESPEETVEKMKIIA